MSGKHRNGGGRGHQEISALLPWYVNGTIGEPERQRVDEHLAICVLCREDMAEERRIYLGMTAVPAVEYMPAPSLKRLQERLDAVGPARVDRRRDAAGPPSAAAEKSDRSRRWRGTMAASVAVMAAMLCLVAADRWVQFRARTARPEYYTVTTSVPSPPGEVIRAVFSPSISLAELQAILGEAELRIVAGPTEAGVYSLAANSPRPVNSSLVLLRGHAAVRFAEITQPPSGTGAAP
jgi:anti-sigma factor RsiW